MKNKLPILILALVNVSCAMMNNRTYLSEMEYEDDGSYFTPKEDFPVVDGDTGKVFRSRRDIASRTPAQGSERWELEQRYQLKDELKDLKSELSEPARAHYDDVKDKLPTISEKIYFLRLQTKPERDEYIASKGYAPVYSSARDSILAIHQEDVLVGMSKDEVISSLGHPSNVEVAGNPRNENERWYFNRDGQRKFIFFEAGRVQGWTENP
jgi:hypothetical protein